MCTDKRFEQLDRLSNPGLSKKDLMKAKQLERERRRRKKAKRSQNCDSKSEVEDSDDENPV